MKTILVFIILFYSFSCNKSSDAVNYSAPERDTCEGPDADILCSFRDMPQNLSSSLIITSNPNDGEKLIIEGKLLKSDGKPAKDIIMYLYHTDKNGYYSKRGNEKGVQKWHGYLHGWIKTDSEGSYKLETIRPAPYPDGGAPAHIHAAIKTSGEHYYISDFVFKDDKLVNDDYLSRLNMPGGKGVVDIQKDKNGVWYGRRDIVLK